MFTLPLHPMIVHLPLGIGILAPILALVTLARSWNAASLRTLPWALVVLAQATALAGGLAAARTGEEDEEKVERIVSEKLIEEHEENAELFNVLAGVAMAGGIAALLLRGTASRAMAVVALVGSLAAAGQGFRTGHTGGVLVYREGAAAAHGTSARLPGTPPAPQENADDDDD